STSLNEDEAPSRPDQRPERLWWQETLLRAAARVSLASGRAAPLVLRRSPGLVARARAVADEVDVDGTVLVEAAGPTISLAGRGLPMPRPSPRSSRRLAPLPRTTARVRADCP